MKLFMSSIFAIAMLFTVQSSALGADGGGGREVPMSRQKALNMYKNHINAIVQRVEKQQTAAGKRKVMNKSFGHMISVFDKVSNMGMISNSDKKALLKMENNLREKKQELNGKDGYARISDQNLTNYAHYVQQDMEQAKTITLSLSIAALVLIIVLLLLL